ncbi:MAG: tRNA lysidine(34) synthetase TilS [Clostridia bacterium]|nr:tRNA lysidine(34) synthetase TilS [Clostridia bacterium]
MMDLQRYKGKRICVAVSGGVDSVCLLHYLKSVKETYGFSLSAVHCEHGIRGEESLADMRFVQNLCKEWGIELVLFQEDCPARAKNDKVSLETAARAFRYACFSALVQDEKTDFIATAHHKDDDAETVLFRLARGTSLSGVGGMYEENGYLLRPFLSWTREKIEEYAKKHALSYCVDKTNGETDATRNKLRLEVLPRLNEAVHGASEGLVRFAKLATEDDELLYEYAKPLLSVADDGVFVDFCEKKPLFRRACLLALKALGVEKDYTALHLESVYSLQSAERSAKLDLPKGIVAEKTVEGIFFYKKDAFCVAKSEPKTFDKNGFDGGRYEVIISTQPILEEAFPWRVLRLDGAKIPENAVFRFREEGDFMQRFGGGTKPLKKVFNEEKIPACERVHIPVLAAGKEVYAVLGVEISEKVKVGEETQAVLYMQLKKKERKE